ncbi:HAD family hydrolase [Salipiger bermudensis]|uniref:HAD-superfamily hydrolase, subfamily IA, variant 1 family protein n=1 Tax=Salipiger bermudensis (strain DSM 26914 / JCM 13377 / KCTC 12554 / HTCC2601) TaxID=314265 RepID=Q0FRJ8_SALBH|nr:HAD family phosphatase [Salipiger bermudensis]EAU46856.1 HAD-superfamily hydrolase, subfamily IA, variant 1 family protein [Salipiger bermudensis HTCC2601]
MAIQAVIFDIGNVLLRWQPELYYDALIGEARRREMFAEVDLHGMNERIDAGEDFRAVVYDTAAAHPRWAEQIRHWHDRWPELAAPEIPESGETLRELRRNGVPVFALSNIGEATMALAEAAYPVLKDFDRRYVSGLMGVTKPDPRIYEMVEADCGLAPETLLFTDDRADNIAAAAARGWQTHLFEGPEGWAACLRAHGLLSEGDDT